MTTLRQAAQQALYNFENMAEANWRNWQELSSANEYEAWIKRRATQMAENLRAALKAPEQEPVAFRKVTQDGFYRYYESDETQPELCEPLYATPEAAPEQEPVATVQCVRGITFGYLDVMQPVGAKLYAAPENQVLQAKCDAFLANVQLLEAEIAAMAKERDALKADAERYRWLRRSATKLSFDNALIGSLVRDQSELDAAMGVAP